MKIKVLILLVFCFLSALSWSQKPEGCSHDRNKLIEGIRLGESGAIICAGGSGDASLIPVLQREYREWEKAQRQGTLEELQVALARLSAQAQVKEIVCELEFGAARVRIVGARHLTGIGGWLAIHTFSQFLTDLPENTRSIGSDGDVIYPSMQTLTMQQLAEAVKDPPVSEPTGLEIDSGTVSRKAVVWQQWIKSHQNELQRLKPNDDIKLTEMECHQILSGDPVSRTQK